MVLTLALIFTHSFKSLGLREKSGSSVTDRLKSETVNFAWKFHAYARYLVKNTNSDKKVQLNSLLKTDSMIRLVSYHPHPHSPPNSTSTRPPLDHPTHHHPIATPQWHHEATSFLGGPTAPNKALCYLIPSSDGTIENDDAHHSMSLWQLEVVDSAKGQIAEWNKKYRVRHTMTMHYLAVGDQTDEEEDEDGFFYFKARLVDLKKHPHLAHRTEFRFGQTESQPHQYMSLDDCSFRLKHVFKTPEGNQKTVECSLHAGTHHTFKFDAAADTVHHVDRANKTEEFVPLSRTSQGPTELPIVFRDKEGTEDAFQVVYSRYIPTVTLSYIPTPTMV